MDESGVYGGFAQRKVQAIVTITDENGKPFGKPVRNDRINAAVSQAETLRQAMPKGYTVTVSQIITVHEYVSK